MTTSFRIATEPAGPGRGGWWWVRIYDQLEAMHRAALRYHPQMRDDEWGKTLACVQPIAGGPREVLRTGAPLAKGRMMGVIRLVRPFTYEIAAHEVGHAALATYRMMVRPNANYGRFCHQAEEDFCYLLGELYDQLMGGLQRLANATPG